MTGDEENEPVTEPSSDEKVTNQARNLRHAISVLENYGDHHEWCARAGGSGEPCNCGLWDELDHLRAALPADEAEADDPDHIETCRNATRNEAGHHRCQCPCHDDPAS